jgi:hypothetical protein
MGGVVGCGVLVGAAGVAVELEQAAVSKMSAKGKRDLETELIGIPHSGEGKRDASS